MDREIMAPILRDPNLSPDAVVILSRIVQHLTRHSHVYMGECGIRGGYAEVVNMDPEVMAMLQKSISAKLCPTVIGQACMDVVVNPPKPGDPSHDSWS